IATRRVEERLAVAGGSFAPHTDEHRQMRSYLPSIAGPERTLDRALQLRAGGVRLVGVEHANHLLDLPRERSVRGHLSIRERPTPDHASVALLLHRLRELGAEPALADPGGTEERHELRAAVGDDALPGAKQRL